MLKVIVSTQISLPKNLSKKDEKRYLTADYFLNNTSDLVAYLDVELNIVWANRAARNSVGKTRSAMKYVISVQYPVKIVRYRKL